jgi:hypothetical protein
MSVGKSFYAILFTFFALLAASPANAQTNCTASQQAAVECFVSNAVATDLTQPRYGMTLAQFESYGFAVSQILQTHHTYLVLIGVSSAVADAMPPTNANGTANQDAQDAAVTQIVLAASTLSIASAPKGTSVTDLEHFALDVTNAMNDNSGLMELLTPGISLRIIDSYLITATTNGQINWTTLNSTLSAAVNTFISSGIVKVPPGMTAAQVNSFANSLAHIIYNYKFATRRTTLNTN